MKTLRLDPDISYESPEEELVFNEQIEQVNRIVSRMPKVRRRIFEMKYNDGLSNEEIARELNITQSTVRSHIRYISQEIMTYA
jgi:RNA polymerase sigma factor (sigma-70 family)